MTECSQEVFQFAPHFSRRVETGFSAGRVSSDGGALLLREAEGRIGPIQRLAACFTDRRGPDRVGHRLGHRLAQRIHGLALGYEDLNDHERLRHDPLLAVLSGKREIDQPLAGKSTLNRLERPGGAERHHQIDYEPEKIDALLCDLFIESHTAPPEQAVLDLDATDIPLHGHPPERFFHGDYGSYCYLPLCLFCGDQLRCARLRPSGQDAARGALDEVARIVGQLRLKWPQVKIVLRADSGFCREEPMAWGEQNKVDFLLGLARNSRLRKIVGKQRQEAKLEPGTTGKPARVFAEFDDKTKKSWARERRVVAKAESLDKGENPRFVVTSPTPDRWPAREVYENLCCARGAMENRVKERMSLFADRLSTEERKGNQLRLHLSALAYTLVEALRRLALKGTEWAQAQVDTIRLKLLKIGAVVKIRARRVPLELSSTYPWKHLYTQAFEALRS
jgi:hypothetical protein